jgi:beta-lactamase class D
MLKLFVFTTLVAAITACSGLGKKEGAITSEARYFPKMTGCFLLYNMKTSQFDKIIGQKNCLERLSPCSTFKVPLAVMAFDSGVLKDENVILKWDGKKGPRAATNRDQNAKTWIKDSVVWVSQRLTPQIGKRKIDLYLIDFNYGNEDFSAGLTKAWLIPPGSKEFGLRISAYEQVDFMKKLWTETLPVSPRSMKLTQDITFLETSPKGFKLSGKTGSNSYAQNPKLRLGWFISHLQSGDQEYITAANFSDVEPQAENISGGIKAKKITKQILADMGLW